MSDSIFTVVKSTDPRLKAGGHTFSAALGASAISVVSQTAATSSTSTLVFSVVPPSPQVVIQKAPLLDITLALQCNWIGVAPVNTPIAVYGRDFAIARAAPLGQLIQTATVQINNAVVQQVRSLDLNAKPMQYNPTRPSAFGAAKCVPARPGPRPGRAQGTCGSRHDVPDTSVRELG